MSVKRQIFINNKGIDGEIANNMTFDFDFNVDKNILEKIKAKKESNKLNTKFQQCGDKYFGSWFYPNCMDVYVMVTPFLMGVRNDMENFKLMTVARTMGIEIDENKLHDATYDIELTRDIFYRIIGKMDIKL